MTPNKERALAALLTCKTKVEAAAQAGITDRQIRNYFQDADFQTAYKEAFGGMVEDATRQAQQAIQPALSTLREITEDGNENSGTRIQAARNMLEFAMRLTETLDINDRLKAIEKALKE